MMYLLATLNVFGPSTLTLTSLILTIGLLALRSYVHEAKLDVARSSLVWLDSAVVALAVLFFVFVFLRFRYLA